jgi:hypothetical protein
MGPEGKVTVDDEDVNLPYAKTWRNKHSVSIIKAGETVGEIHSIVYDRRTLTTYTFVNSRQIGLTSEEGQKQV